MEGSGPFHSPTRHTWPSGPSLPTHRPSPSWLLPQPMCPPSPNGGSGGPGRAPCLPRVRLTQHGGLVLGDPEAHSTWPGCPPAPSTTHVRLSCVLAAPTSDPAKPLGGTSALPPSCAGLLAGRHPTSQQTGVSALLLWHQHAASFWVIWAICPLCLRRQAHTGRGSPRGQGPEPGSPWVGLGRFGTQLRGRLWLRVTVVLPVSVDSTSCSLSSLTPGDPRTLTSTRILQPVCSLPLKIRPCSRLSCAHRDTCAMSRAPHATAGPAVKHQPLPRAQVRRRQLWPASPQEQASPGTPPLASDQAALS